MPPHSMHCTTGSVFSHLRQGRRRRRGDDYEDDDDDHDHDDEDDDDDNDAAATTDDDLPGRPTHLSQTGCVSLAGGG
jgi:hypothetical protein